MDFSGSVVGGRGVVLAGGCGCAREDPGTLIGPGSLSPDRWVYAEGLGEGPPPPGANTTPWRTQWFLFIGAPPTGPRAPCLAASKKHARGLVAVRRPPTRRPLSADSPSVTTYAGSSNAPNQAASRWVGSSGHGRPPGRSWQVPARRTSHRRAGALRWIDVATEKAPTDRGLKVTKGEAPSRRLLAGRKTHVARFRRFRQFIGTLRGGKPSVF